MVDGNLEIHYHLLQKILRLSHIDIKQMLLILPVQSCSCISDSIQTVPEGKQSTVVRKEVSLWLHKETEPQRQRGKSDLSWQRKKSVAIFYQKQ